MTRVTNPLIADLNLDGYALVGGTLKRPDGTTAVSFDADGGLTLYYGDGNTIALHFQDTRRAFTLNTPTGNVLLSYDADTDTLRFDGNNPLLLSSGGLDVNSYPVQHVADPLADDDAATKRYVDQAIAAALGTP